MKNLFTFESFLKKNKKSKFGFSGGFAFREYILGLPKEEREKALKDPKIRAKYGLDPLKEN